MFRRLHRILVCAVIAIFAFFILTSVAFSQSSSEDFAPSVWPYRWFLLDGWMGTLYLAVFGSIAWLWRPTGNNLRLSMSDEIGQDEGMAGEDFEIGEFGQHGDPDDDDDAAERGELKKDQSGGRPSNEGGATATGRQGASTQGRMPLHGDETVFEIGDEDDTMDGDALRQAQHHSERNERGTAGERQGLMGGEEGDAHDADNDSRETLVPRRGEKAQ